MNTRLPDPFDAIFTSFFLLIVSFSFSLCFFWCSVCVRKFLGLLCLFLRFGSGTQKAAAPFVSFQRILLQAMNPIQQRLLALANTPADQLSTLGGFGGGPRSNPYNLHSAQHQEQLAAAAAAPPPHHHHSVPRLDDGEPPQVRYLSFQICPRALLF
jgi:hypothetical protein